MLERVFLFFCFFPFVSPYPIGSDIQPLAGILALLVIFKNGIILHIKLPKPYVVLLAFSCLLLVYHNPVSSDFNPDLGKMVSLLFGTLILAAFYYSRHKLDSRFINSVVGIYFVFTLLLLVFTTPMIQVQNLVIRNTNSVDFTYRGVATLATEPGLFGGLLVFFLLVVDFLKEEGKVTLNNQYVLYAMILFMLLWTKSGTGYLYLMIYLILKFYMSNIVLYYKMLSIILLSSSMVFLIAFLSRQDPTLLGRGAHVLIQLSDPQALMNSDASILTRIVDVSMAFVSIFEHPIGVGNGNVVAKSYELMLNTPFIKNFYVSNNKIFGLNSSFSYITIAYGVFAWAFLILVYLNNSKSNISCKFFSFLFFAVSYSSAFPAIWVLLALRFGERSSKSSIIQKKHLSMRIK